MPKCQKIKKKKRQVCIGEMRDEIMIELRSITPPALGSVDYTEDFDNKITCWSTVETVSGETVFDGTNTEVDVTHKIKCRFDDRVTAEDWIRFNGDRFDVIDAENLDSRSEFMILRCTNRGTTLNRANDV